MDWRSLADFRIFILINNYFALYTFIFIVLQPLISDDIEIQASEDLSKAIKIKPNEEAYRIRGNTYLIINDYRGAIEDYTKVIDLNPRFHYQGNYLHKEIVRLQKLLDNE